MNHAKKVNIIQQQSAKLHLSIIEAQQGDARHLHNKYEIESFDRILVDAPCSGLGVIRNKPDVKYNKQKNDIVRLSTIQLEILNSVAPLLKKDGFLMYSTCTVDAQENENVVKTFLEKNANFKIDEQFFKTLPKAFENSNGLTPYGLQIFPQTYQTDGFFLSRLIKR